MITIPKQLNTCRFLYTSQKKPIDIEWTTKNNYVYDDFKPADTYGVLCGCNSLIVVDCDQKYIQDKLLQHEEFRNTFTVETATKHLNHFYFFINNNPTPQGYRLNNNRDERIVDIQGAGTMVVGPNSKLTTGNIYKIVNDCEILHIDYGKLQSIILNIDDDLKIIQRSEKKSKFLWPEFDEICKAIKNKLKIKDLLLKYNYDITKNPTMCPLGHKSEGGECFSYTDDTWYCFHCMQYGNIFQLYQKMKGVSFIEAKNALAKLTDLDKEMNVRILQLYSDPSHRHDANELLCKEFMKIHKVYTIRNDKDAEIYIYKNGLYVPEGKSFIKEFTRHILGRLYNERFIKTVIDKIIVDSFIEVDRFFVDPPAHLIPLKNGIYDLTENTMIDYHPKYKFLTRIPIIYDPIAMPKKILKFIKDIVKTNDDIALLQELGGYLLLRENKYEKAFMCLGSGRNGKSKLIEVFTHLIGHNNSINISLNQIEKDSFALCNFHNKYANFCADISSEALEGTGHFKSLTGRDDITANRKFKSSITFKNYAKMIFSANTLPQTADKTDAFFDRWIIINFPYTFVNNPTLPHHKLKNENIINEILDDNELSGFFNWCITGLNRITKNKDFTKSSSTDEIKKTWLMKSSSFTAFWMDNVTTIDNFEEYEKISDIYVEYNKYCNKYRLNTESTKARRKLLEEDFNVNVVRTFINGEKTFIIKGIALTYSQPTKHNNIQQSLS